MPTSKRVALITGASRGIGRATAAALGRDGTDVILTYASDAEGGASTVAEVRGTGARAAALQLDLGALETFDHFVSSLKAVLGAEWDREDFDYLINNGGIQRAGSFSDTTEEQFDDLVNVNFKGTFFLTQKLAPVLVDGGTIINISSGVTRFYAPQHVIYATLKGAIEVLTRYTAQELGPRQITVNTVAPGATATDFFGGALRDDPQTQQWVASSTALGRYGQAEDIGPAIAALLRDETHWLNGQRIEVSGGVNL